MTTTVSQDVREAVEAMYAAFNRRDVEALLARVVPQVVWANGMEGGYVHGREELRAYWERQFGLIRSSVEPRRVEADPDGSLVVDGHQVVRSAAGDETLSEGRVKHRLTFDGKLIQRFEICRRGGTEMSRIP